MDFLLRVPKENELSFKIEYISKLESINPQNGVLYVEKLDHLDYKEEKIGEGTQCYLFGDVINFSTKDATKHKGFFYIIKWDQIAKTIELYSDYQNFLPIYYYEGNDYYLISSSVDTIYNLLGELDFNQDFVTEIALLNAPFEDSCFFKHIKRLNYSCYLRIDSNGLREIRTIRFYDYFAESPIRYKKAINQVVESFIDNCSQYFTEPSYVSLTGGFDGRAVTSIAHYRNNDFIAFSHGKAENFDVYIPLKLSQKLRFPYKFIELGDDYIKNYYERFVKEYLRYSGGMNGFLYPHTLYDTYVLSETPRPIVTGYIGSELLRNAHCAGAITSKFIIDYLSFGDDIARGNAQYNPNYTLLKDYLDLKLVQDIMERIKNYFTQLPRELNNNQKLACFEFEEVLPKLFGTWVYSGMHYSRIRGPFVDRQFFNEIVKTEVSQFYRKFLEQNPLKRFWGQYFYAQIIHRTWPQIGKEMSAKGYTPADLLSLLGRIRITYGYAGKKKRIRKGNLDNLSLISGMLHYRKSIDDPTLKETVSDEYAVQLLHNEQARDILFLKLSVYEYVRMKNSNLDRTTSQLITR